MDGVADSNYRYRDSHAGGCSGTADMEPQKIQPLVPPAAMKQCENVCLIRTVKCPRHSGLLSTFIISGELFLADFDHIK